MISEIRQGKDEMNLKHPMIKKSEEIFTQILLWSNMFCAKNIGRQALKDFVIMMEDIANE